MADRGGAGHDGARGRGSTSDRRMSAPRRGGNMRSAPMGGYAKLRGEIQLTPGEVKRLAVVVMKQKLSESDVCRLLLISHLKTCREAGVTGVLPSLPKDERLPPRPSRPSAPRSKPRLERFKHWSSFLPAPG